MAMSYNDKELDRELKEAFANEFADPSTSRLDNMRRKILADVPEEKPGFAWFNLKNIIAYGAVSVFLFMMILPSVMDNGVTDSTSDTQLQFSNMLENEEQLDLMVAVLGDFAEEDTNSNLLGYSSLTNSNWLIFDTTEDSSDNLYDL